MDIFARLTADHDAHRELAESLLDAQNPEKRRTLFERLRRDVEAHANAEEQTFYAALLAQPDVQQTARHSIIEHEELEELFEAAERAGPQGDEWPDAIAALVDRLKHHMHEEEDDVFPEAREVLSPQDAISMVQAFEARKDDDIDNTGETAFVDETSARYTAPSV